MDGIVYLITNTTNGKKYVGSTSNTLEERMRSHKRHSTQSKTKHRPLYKAMRETGWQHFTIEALIQLKYFHRTELCMVEDAYISIHDTINNGYNQRYNTIQHKNDQKGKRVNQSDHIAYMREYNKKMKDKREAQRQAQQQ